MLLQQAPAWPCFDCNTNTVKISVELKMLLLFVLLSSWPPGAHKVGMLAGAAQHAGTGGVEAAAHAARRPAQHPGLLGRALCPRGDPL